MIERELDKKHKYLNSYFEEVTRVPKDYKDDKIIEYLHKHREWFLDKYHSNQIPKFEENILKEYGKDILERYLKEKKLDDVENFNEEEKNNKQLRLNVI
jgi:predicted hydrocarbon binding protein